MMLLSIDLTSDESIYRQIRNQIVRGIASGELAPGDSLPSVRALASDLGVNMHTVNKAYAVLRDEGYVQMRGRSGAYVADAARPPSPVISETRRERLTDDLSRLAIELRAQGGTREDFLDLAKTQADAVFGTASKEKGTRR